MTEFHVLIGELEETMQSAPNADVNLFGLGESLPFEFMRKAPQLTKSSCLFIKESGLESALV